MEFSSEGNYDDDDETNDKAIGKQRTKVATKAALLQINEVDSDGDTIIIMQAWWEKETIKII